MNKNALKEKLRKEILNCNSSAVKGYDLSLFDDNDSANCYIVNVK